jgi:hypothetical protein
VPRACFHADETHLYVDPEVCIDCGAHAQEGRRYRSSILARAGILPLEEFVQFLPEIIGATSEALGSRHSRTIANFCSIVYRRRRILSPRIASASPLLSVLVHLASGYSIADAIFACG